MEEFKKTDCECPLAGYCQRHGMNKTPHQHKLCQSHPGYFRKWEEGHGPGGHAPSPPPTFSLCQFCHNKGCNGQCRVTAPPTDKVCQFCKAPDCNGECRNKLKGPSLLQKAKNVAAATKEAAKDGFKTSSEEEVKRRLEICHGCEFFIPEKGTCNLCGCVLRFKTKLQSSHCPKDKW